MLVLCPNGADCTDETIGGGWWHRLLRSLRQQFFRRLGAAGRLSAQADNPDDINETAGTHSGSARESGREGAGHTQA